MLNFAAHPKRINIAKGSNATIDLVGQVKGQPTQIDRLGDIQIHVTGTLDGGTWGVDALFDDTDIWVPLVTGKDTLTVAADVYRIPDTYVMVGLRVTFANLGGAAVPVAHFALQGRLARLFAGW